MATFLARRRLGYRATEVAKPQGYSSHGGVLSALSSIESVGPVLRRRVQQLNNTLAND